ncbi:Nucleotidylyl transferase [Ascodesmis nigricans]|uniref:Nicotinamide-nucleotide adenylyltransferase n=1 Tax=Ascodesmis nigricans TaxID=341454 RepID=A0A4S2MYR4_9PEZI|nr:Nucleotidylyl transferase [Ascodesmis nigricans]
MSPTHPTILTAPPTPSNETPSTYTFPSDRLLRSLENPSLIPLILVACGSFSPITHMHLRMFEMAVDHVRQNLSDTYEVVGGYISPVSDRYNKAGLASATHRIRMCELACEQTSDWLMVDPWEAEQPDYQPTAVVLDHVADEANKILEPLMGKKVQVSLLCGADLLMSMTPGVWSVHDLDHILLTYGLFVIERNGTSVSEAIAQLKELNPEWTSKVQIIRQLIPNDISSTSIRQFLRLGLSVHYLLPWCVIQYIREKGLYMDEGKEKRPSSMPPIGRRGRALQEQQQDRQHVQEKDGPQSLETVDEERHPRTLLRPEDATQSSN